MSLDLIAVPLVIRIQMEARIWDYFKFPKNGGVSGTKFQLFPVMSLAIRSLESTRLNLQIRRVKHRKKKVLGILELIVNIHEDI